MTSLFKPPEQSKNGKSPKLSLPQLTTSSTAPLSPVPQRKVSPSYTTPTGKTVHRRPPPALQIPDVAKLSISDIPQDRVIPKITSNYDSSNCSTPTVVPDLEDVNWQQAHRRKEIQVLGILGEGAGGSVSKCQIGSSVFALKTITTCNDPDLQKQIFRELQFNQSCKSDFIVRYYGMFNDEASSSIYIAMEYMGGRSLDSVYKNIKKRGGRISEKVLGKIAEGVLRGLSYLHERKIIHRDIKPQNVLLDCKGHVKLCDFGVSGEAVNSLATTFTGTSYYMAPERIKGQPYSVTSDVWSLGLTLLEVAQGFFPFELEENLPPIELLMLILTFKPELKDDAELGIKWSESFKSFLEYCLKKESQERPSPRQMLQHPWIVGQQKKTVNMEKFVKSCWET